MKSNMRENRLSAVLLLIVPLLAACNGAGSASDTATQVDSNNVGLAVPDIILSARAVQRDRLIVDVTISDIDVPMNRVGEVWQGSFTLPDSGTHILTITWSELFGPDNNNPLRLATTNRTIDSNSPRNMNLPFSGYQINQFDDDNDNIPNLTERIQNTPPRPFSGNNRSAMVLPGSISNLASLLGRGNTANNTLDYWHCTDGNAAAFRYVFKLPTEESQSPAGSVSVVGVDAISTGFYWQPISPDSVLITNPVSSTQEELSSIRFIDAHNFTAFIGFRESLECRIPVTRTGGN